MLIVKRIALCFTIYLVLSVIASIAQESLDDGSQKMYNFKVADAWSISSEDEQFLLRVNRIDMGNGKYNGDFELLMYEWLEGKKNYKLKYEKIYMDTEPLELFSFGSAVAGITVLDVSDNLFKFLLFDCSGSRFDIDLSRPLTHQKVIKASDLKPVLLNSKIRFTNAGKLVPNGEFDLPKKFCTKK